MFLLPTRDPAGNLVLSATDIINATSCEYAALRRLDVLLDRIDAQPVADDPMAEMVARLGDRHEADVLEKLQDNHPGRIVYIPGVPAYNESELRFAHEGTVAALTGNDADVVYQASFFDGSFHGRADFLIREADGTWSVNDTKLARSVKDHALLQLAAYAEQMTNAGIPVSPTAHLILGTGERTSHELADVMGAYQSARAHLTALLEQHRAGASPAAWGAHGIKSCLRCADCLEAIKLHDDLMLVRSMNRSRRTKLHKAGITTTTALATAVLEEPDEMMRGLQDQARVQTGILADGTINGVSWKVREDHLLDSMPAPSDGDIFFDFEGDPLWLDEASGEWGIEYLFGLLQKPLGGGDPEFVAFTAHDMAQEKQALIDFIAHVQERRAVHPDLHIYHYAFYEATALRKLAARHGVCAAEVEELIEAGVLFDLYETVKNSIRISDRSMSIKKLEPLYMDEARDGVANAVDSIAHYAAYRQHLAAGEDDQAKAVFDGIVQYNTYDCWSTLKLRDWLLGLRAGVPTAS